MEVSLLFQVVCLTMLDVNKLQELEGSVAVFLCNFKRIFPPVFFDLMEHLIIHLSYEEHVGGPVQYRWMYPFESISFLNELYEYHRLEDPNIDLLVATEFKDCFKCHGADIFRTKNGEYDDEDSFDEDYKTKEDHD
ncbi:UNVERIFIED_CONTAM: hypothetical protein Slati_4187800 [Sesamum latifolium]|uniref:DUF4218 domain-containing protein n=1 Tax=Sesamum latifolium TaxID=2727402 RepID=A0AAW2T9Y1_9LAMI